jgi:hypothetical protein
MEVGLVPKEGKREWGGGEGFLSPFSFGFLCNTGVVAVGCGLSAIMVFILVVNSSLVLVLY